MNESTREEQYDLVHQGTEKLRELMILNPHISPGLWCNAMSFVVAGLSSKMMSYETYCDTMDHMKMMAKSWWEDNEK